MKWLMWLSCKLGMHDVWFDTVGRNVGTEKTPIYFMETTAKCHNCAWKRQDGE